MDGKAIAYDYEMYNNAATITVLSHALNNLLNKTDYTPTHETVDICSLDPCIAP